MPELPLTIELIEDGILVFSFLTAGSRIECITNFVQQGPTLRLLWLHLQGAAPNQVGRAALWQVARQIVRHFEATTVVIEGGRRTTGRYKGQVPTPFVIHVSES